MQDRNDKGFALYDGLSGSASEDLANGNDLSDLFADLESTPVELLEESKEFEKRDDDLDALSDLDLTPGVLDKSNDSVRIYLREMGMVPLLTREGEIELARRIERGENAVRKALSRSRLVIQTIFETRNAASHGSVSIFDILQAPDPHPAEDEQDVVRQLEKQFFEATEEIEKLYGKAQRTESKLISTSRNLKAKQYRKLRFEYARLAIRVSRKIRDLPFTSRYQRFLGRALKNVVEKLKPLEQEIARVQRTLEQLAPSESGSASALRKELRALSSQLADNRRELRERGHRIAPHAADCRSRRDGSGPRQETSY